MIPPVFDKNKHDLTTDHSGLVTAIVRIVEFYNYGWNNGFKDPFWIASTILSWTVVEPGVYHLTACLITFRPLFRWIITDSPLSSAFSRSRLFSGNKQTRNGTASGKKSLPSSTHAGTMDDRSDRKVIVNPGIGFGESFATADEEPHELDDLDVERSIQIKHDFQASTA